MEKREFRACDKTAWNPHGMSVPEIFIKISIKRETVNKGILHKK